MRSRTAAFAAAVLLTLAAASGDSGPTTTTSSEVVALSAETVITADQAASTTVELPQPLLVHTDIPSFSFDGDQVVVTDGWDNFVALTLVPEAEQVGENLPKLSAVKLPTPGEPTLFMAVHRGRDEDRLEAGRYRLSLVTTGPVSVRLALPSLSDATRTISPDQPLGFHVLEELQEPTPTGQFGPAFSAGGEHTTDVPSQVYAYVWQAGAPTAGNTANFCEPFGTAPSAGGIYTPDCGVGGQPRGPSLTVIRVPDEHLSLTYTWTGKESARYWDVGAYTATAGSVTGGGTFWLWIDG